MEYTWNTAKKQNDKSVNQQETEIVDLMERIIISKEALSGTYCKKHRRKLNQKRARAWTGDHLNHDLEAAHH